MYILLNSINFATLYRELFAALIDAMHRKFDKNAQSSNQMKTWDNSVKLVDQLLSIAKSADLSRVFFFYLKVNFDRIQLFYFVFFSIFSFQACCWMNDRSHDTMMIVFLLFSRIHTCTSSYFCSMEYSPSNATCSGEWKTWFPSYKLYKIQRDFCTVYVAIQRYCFRICFFLHIKCIEICIELVRVTCNCRKN